jgi:hypothetical protein
MARPQCGTPLAQVVVGKVNALGHMLTFTKIIHWAHVSTMCKDLIRRAYVLTMCKDLIIYIYILIIIFPMIVGGAYY